MNQGLMAVVASGLLALNACTRDAGSDTEQKPPSGQAWLLPKQIEAAHILLDEVAEKEVGNTVITTGRIAFDDSRVTHVFSPVTGRVTRLLAQPGDRVGLGTPLAVLASPDLGQTYSDYLKAEADLVMARKEHERQKELFEAHAGAQRDLEAAEDNFRKAQAEVERARSKLRLLTPDPDASATQEFLLRSPIAGEVITRTVNPGTEVQGQYSGGTAVELFTVGELDRVWVLGDVYEVDLARVKKGAAVRVQVVTYPDRVFEGTVDWVAGALDPQSRTTRVRCVIANADRALLPEMYATVAIGVGGRRALAVPRTALLRLGDQTYAFVQKGHGPQGQLQFERRPVTVDDDTASNDVPVRSGLSAGDRVVTSGAILLAGMI